MSSESLTSPTSAHRRCACTRPVSVVFLAVFGLTVLHIGWSLMYESQYNDLSITTSLQNHYHSYKMDGATNNFYFFLLPQASSSGTNRDDSGSPSSTIKSSHSSSLTSISIPSKDELFTLPSKWLLSSTTTTTSSSSLAGSSHLDTHKIVQLQREQDPRPFVAIVLCTRSKPEWTHINETSLYTLLIPSIEKTVTPDEWKTYRIELFLGFDIGDRFWEDRQHRHLLQSTTARTQPHLGINFMALTKQRPSQIPFNSACRAAYELGSDYIVRINDDTEFLTPLWITMGVQQLSKFRPSKLGVVGPLCGQGNTDILTHDMVHRLHLDIFGMEYYPDEFDNWWIDDWITLVYGQSNTKRIDEWEVHHHINKHGTRYRVDERLKQHLDTTLRRGKEKIRKYVQDHSRNGDGDLRIPKNDITYQVLGSNRLPAAWGPSMDPIYNS
jgi:hypothetical protein